MRYLIIRLFILLIVMINTGCNFHRHGTTQVTNNKLKTLILTSADVYGPLARTVSQQLRINNIILVEDNKQNKNDTPILRLDKEVQKSDTASMFINGTTAEYSLVMNVSAQVEFPGKGIYPISTTVYRSFFDNANSVMAHDFEKNMMVQEMRQRAAEQLVRTLLTTLYTVRISNNDMIPVSSSA
ncbi:LPS assembly lipoprotein LptE [Pantoea sp. Nvir]|uniref:LPS assembly lipoprotein LptE n=1 Tax=Pantoea sp. Nvir TaxID=2576760 RepID=UPI0027FE25E0|nr:LPS assembly lipoprotein LptE [Pantoea sp. Nvir]CAJ0993021.1 LPS-assembly lipoprotein LptE [Pantoea sp. Nvir]